MKKFFPKSALLLFAAAVLIPCRAGADKVVLKDNFINPHRRSLSINIPAAASEWQKDVEITDPAGRILLRYFTRDALKKVELKSADSGKTLWQTTDFSKPAILKTAPGKNYLLRIYGIPAKTCRLDLSSRNEFGRMIAWHNEASRTTVQSRGILLTPTGNNARIYGRCFQLQKNKIYTLSLEAESLEPQSVSIVVAKHKVARRVVSFPLEAGKSTVLSADYQLPDDNGNISIHFTKPLRLKTLTIIGKSLSAPVVKKEKPDNDGRFLEERNEEKEPANPALTSPVFYRRAPRLVYPDSIPQEYEISQELHGFGTPGEHVLLYATLFNPAHSRPVGLCSVSDLRSGNSRIAAKEWNISEIGFSNYPRGKLSSQIIPQLILKQSGKILEADRNRMYRFYLKLPRNAVPGKYSGKITLKCGETDLVLPIQISVLPFELMTPKENEFVWSVYSRIQGRPQRTYKGSVRDRYFQDMRDAGITSLHYSMHYSENAVKRLQERRKKQGFTAPPVFYGIRAHQVALKNLGLPANDQLWFRKENVRKEYVRLMKDFDSWMKKYGGKGYNDYYVSCVDEPFLGKMERALWENKLTRAAGIKTAATIYQPRWVKLMAPDLDLSINMFINRDPEILRQLKDIQKEFPKLHYWYLGAGAYDHQEGGLMPNRLMAGFGSFRSGVRGHISFTYQNIGNAIDPFRSPIIRGYGMTFPHPRPTAKEVTIFTLEWDGLCEGIIDYKYLYTLRKLIAEKAGTPAAGNGQKTLDYILKHTTWQDRMTHAQGITARRDLTNDNMDKLRALAADAILKLVREK